MPQPRIDNKKDQGTTESVQVSEWNSTGVGSVRKRCQIGSGIGKVQVSDWYRCWNGVGVGAGVG